MITAFKSSFCVTVLASYNQPSFPCLEREDMAFTIHLKPPLVACDEEMPVAPFLLSQKVHHPIRK